MVFGLFMKRIFIFSILFLVGCSSSGVVPIGDGEFMVTKNGVGPTTGAKVSADLFREAHEFCLGKGMDFKKINVDEKDARIFVRQASSRLEFRCIEKTVGK